MPEHTPTTETVREVYVRAIRNAFVASTGEHSDEFDRWVADVKADAWDAGARWAYEEITGEPEKRFALAPGDNPHRKQVTE